MLLHGFEKFDITMARAGADAQAVFGAVADFVELRQPRQS